MRGGDGALLREAGGALRRTARKPGAYHDRLIERPSVARVLKEAEPFFQMVPIENKPTLAKASAGSASG